ncbi:hypothetical protein D3C86_1481180 [compost metagenome]
MVAAGGAGAVKWRPSPACRRHCTPIAPATCSTFSCSAKTSTPWPNGWPRAVFNSTWRRSRLSRPNASNCKRRPKTCRRAATACRSRSACSRARVKTPPARWPRSPALATRSRRRPSAWPRSRNRSTTRSCRFRTCRTRACRWAATRPAMSRYAALARRARSTSRSRTTWTWAPGSASTSRPPRA